ncbi:MAG: hypothetical protein WDW38_006257 [Sanguina aurantia]
MGEEVTETMKATTATMEAGEMAEAGTVDRMAAGTRTEEETTEEGAGMATKAETARLVLNFASQGGGNDGNNDNNGGGNNGQGGGGQGGGGQGNNAGNLVNGILQGIGGALGGSGNGRNERTSSNGSPAPQG